MASSGWNERTKLCYIFTIIWNVLLTLVMKHFYRCSVKKHLTCKCFRRTFESGFHWEGFPHQSVLHWSTSVIIGSWKIGWILWVVEDRPRKFQNCYPVLHLLLICKVKKLDKLIPVIESQSSTFWGVFLKLSLRISNDRFLDLNYDLC